MNDDTEEGMFYWHHRTIEHINSKHPEDEPYLTVHEFSHTNGKYDGFTFSEASPQSKQEAQWILDAFNAPPVVRVDDATMTTDQCGFPDYEKWEWINQTVKESEVVK